MPRTRDEQLYAKRQQQILDAAKQCFVLEGFHQTSMRQIFARAKISAGGAYNYFSGKDEIVKTLVSMEGADISSLIESTASCKTPLEAIVKLISDSIKYTSHEDALLAIEIYAEACRNPEIKALEQENSERLKTFLQQKVSEGIKQEVINKQFPVADCVEFLMAVLEGYIGRLASNPKLSSKKSASLAKTAMIQFLEKTV